MFAGDPPAEIRIPGPAGDNVVAELPPEPAAPASAAPANDAIVRYTVDLEPRAALGPPAQLRPEVEVRRGQIPVHAAVEWLAGPAALPWIEPRPTQRHLLRITPAGGSALFRIVRIPPEPGAPILVELQGTHVVAGNVHGPDGAPLAGASIWAAGAEAQTDERGRFEVAGVPGGDGVPIVVQAEGMATQHLVLQLTGPADALRFDLAPAATVQVQLAAEAVAGASPQLFVAPAGSGAHTAALAYPFFFQAVRGGVPFDGDGRAQLRDLPRGIAVRLHLQDPLRASVDAPVVTTGAELARAQLRAQEVPLLHGQLILARGGAPADGIVRATVPGAGTRRIVEQDWILPPAAHLDGDLVAHVAADGSFTIGLRQQGRNALVTAIAPGCWQRSVELRGRPDGPAAPWLMPAFSGDAVAETPELRLDFPAAGPFELRIRQHGKTLRDWTRWSPAEPFRVALREPVLLDLDVTRLPLDGSEPTVTQLRDVVVTGAQALVVPH